MKNILIFLAALIILSFLFFIFFLKFSNNPSVVINNKQFFIDIAKTEKEKSKGLSIYKKLPLEKGMLFIFQSEEYYPFWMKDMKFSIDIIYINNNRIVDIFYDVPHPKTENEIPVVITPKSKANYVLEINGGLSRKYNFKKGDLVKLNL